MPRRLALVLLVAVATLCRVSVVQIDAQQGGTLNKVVQRLSGSVDHPITHGKIPKSLETGVLSSSTGTKRHFNAPESMDISQYVSHPTGIDQIGKGKGRSGFPVKGGQPAITESNRLGCPQDGPSDVPPDAGNSISGRRLGEMCNN